jgi:hypothetical protein
MHLFFSAAQGSHLPSQPLLQVVSAALQASHAPQLPQPWCPQPGSGAQNSSHLTAQMVFLTSFVVQTTLQYFSQPQ